MTASHSRTYRSSSEARDAISALVAAVIAAMTSNSPVRWPTLTIKASAASFIVRSIRSANSVEPSPRASLILASREDRTSSARRCSAVAIRHAQRGLGQDFPGTSSALAVPCLGVAQPDFADHGCHVEPDERESGNGRLQLRADAAAVPDDLHVDAAGNDDRDGSPSAVDVQVDDVVVELGIGQVESDAAQIGADVCLRPDLPPALQTQAAHTGVDL